MTRERFCELVSQALDSLPEEFRERMTNIAVLVEDRPKAVLVEDRPKEDPTRRRPHSLPSPRKLLLGLYVGVPRTARSFFDISRGPDHIILYQKNIEAVCHTDAEVRTQIRLTVIHEVGHYFGLSEDQLRDV